MGRARGAPLAPISPRASPGAVAARLAVFGGLQVACIPGPLHHGRRRRRDYSGRQGRATRTGGRTTGMISTKAPTWRMLAAGDGCLWRTAGDRHDGPCLCLGGSIRKCRRVVLEALDAGRHVSIARTEGDALGLPLRCFPVRPCCRQTGPRAAGQAGYLRYEVHTVPR